MPNTKWLKPDAVDSQDLTAGALDFSTSYAQSVKIDQVTLKASVNITETVTITLDSAKGANYDTELAKVGLVAQKNVVWRPQGDLNLQSGDNIRIQCTNANTTGTVYVIVKGEELLR